MSSNGNLDDYVRVPLPSRREITDESCFEIGGALEESASMNGYSRQRNAWNFEFYQQFFDVDTKQVLQRLTWSLIPHPRINFIQTSLKPNADLYGPFWIATTLILTSAIGGNLSNYLQSGGRNTTWQYDFRKVTLASTVIYAYWWLVPLATIVLFYMFSKTTKATIEDDLDPLIGGSGIQPEGFRPLLTYSGNFLRLLSLYGYSFTVFVPVSLLWTLSNGMFHWFLAVIAMLISGAFLAFSLRIFFKNENRKFAGTLIVVLLILHCTFSIGLMLTFFYGSVAANPVNSPGIFQPPEVVQAKH